MKKIQVLTNKRPLIAQQEDNVIFSLTMLWYNQGFAQMYLMIVTVPQVSDMAHGLLFNS